VKAKRGLPAFSTNIVTKRGKEGEEKTPGKGGPKAPVSGIELVDTIDALTHYAKELKSGAREGWVKTPGEDVATRAERQVYEEG